MGFNLANLLKKSQEKADNLDDDSKFTLIVTAVTICLTYFLSLALSSNFGSASARNRNTNDHRNSNQRNAGTNAGGPFSNRGETFQDAFTAITLGFGVENGANRNLHRAGTASGIHNREATPDVTATRARENWEALVDADMERRRRVARRNIEGLRREIQSEVKKRAVKRALKEGMSESEQQVSGVRDTR